MGTFTKVEWLVVTSHAKHLARKYDRQRAAKYLARNGVAVQVAVMILT